MVDELMMARTFHQRARIRAIGGLGVHRSSQHVEIENDGVGISNFLILIGGLLDQFFFSIKLQKDLGLGVVVLGISCACSKPIQPNK